MLALVVGIALIIMVALRVFLPTADLMKLNIPNVAGLSLLSLLLTHYLGEKEKKNFLLDLIFGALIFGCLPWLAGFAEAGSLWLAAVGGIEYALISRIFGSMTERMECTNKAKLAPVCSAFVLFMAFQAFANILI